MRETGLLTDTGLRGASRLEGPKVLAFVVAGRSSRNFAHLLVQPRRGGAVVRGGGALRQSDRGSGQGQLTSTRFEETDSTSHLDAVYHPLK